ncbi:MAG TPA: radical SAM family heme chaperone HemW [Armatimonadota bacterium]|nr:radical SAM family heme chaperone HemW [Armatimonadota bacterium]
MERAGVYIHIPFCRSKCVYCDFCSFPGLEALHAPYVHSLRAELDAAAVRWRDVPFDTAFVGGGTPTAMPVDLLAGIVRTVRVRLALPPDAEVTVEANPGTVDLAVLRALREAGMSRLSLGVQSLNDGELALLGRIHSASEAVEAVRLARWAGVGNLSLDLMYGLPRQTLAGWRATLAQALALVPEHLSLYALTVEEGTPLAAAIARGDLPAPDDGLAADMYLHAEEALDAAGYAHYEISNWARRSPQDPPAREPPRLACRHNVKYWHNERYLGIGSAAASFDGSARYRNVEEPREYLRRLAAGDSPVAEREEPDLPTRIGETMMLGLRLTGGVGWEAFRRRYGRGMEEIYGAVIARLAEDGLLVRDAAGIRLTSRGRLLGNRVFAEFLPDR